MVEKIFRRMIEKIYKKHVTLSICNGSVLEGFVTAFDEQHAELIETDNSLVIVKLEDISFARIGVGAPKEEPIPQYRPTIEHASKSDFSMATPTPSDGEEEAYRRPTFVRTTSNDINQ